MVSAIEASSPPSSTATGLATQPRSENHVWKCDFEADRAARGSSIIILNVCGEFIRECLCILVEPRINATRVQGILCELICAYGRPEYNRSDNGS